MTLEEQRALHEEWTRGTIRKCVIAFAPFLLGGLGIIGWASAAIIDIVKTAYEEGRNDIKSLYRVSLDTNATLTNVQFTLGEHEKQILELQKRRR